MARYYKKRRASSRFRRRRYGRKLGRRTGYKRLARTIKRVVRSSSEIKYSYDQISAGTFDPSLSAGLCYFHFIQPAIAQGVDVNQRIGNQILVRRVSMKGLININPGSNGVAGQTEAAVRVIIGRFKESPRAWPGIDVNDLLDNTNFFAQTDKNLVQTYMDKIYYTAASGSSSYANTGLPNIIRINKSIKWRKMMRFYSSAKTYGFEYNDMPFIAIFSNTSVNQVSCAYWNCIKCSFIDN